MEGSRERLSKARAEPATRGKVSSGAAAASGSAKSREKEPEWNS